MGYGYQNKISHLYDAAVIQAASDGEEWKKVCTLVGKLYNYEFINILMVYMQKPRLMETHWPVCQAWQQRHCCIFFQGIGAAYTLCI